MTRKAATFMARVGTGWFRAKKELNAPAHLAAVQHVQAKLKSRGGIQRHRLDSGKREEGLRT